MRLSEAIRLGAMLRPQAFGVCDPDRSCALQAMAEALGVQRHEGYRDALFKHWPWVHELRAHCPACNCDGIKESTISHLNDLHKWTRERIADWVETIEPQPLPALSPVAQGQEVGACTK